MTIQTGRLALSSVYFDNVYHRLPELNEVHPFLDGAEGSVNVEQVERDGGNGAVRRGSNLGQHGQEVQEHKGTLVSGAENKQDVLVAVVVLQENVARGTDVLVRFRARSRHQAREVRHNIDGEHCLEGPRIIRVQLSQGDPQARRGGAIGNHIQHRAELGR